MQEQEIFQQYELKNWDFSPRLYKILGASALVNIFIFVALAQANFLTSKSCDSPIVSGVCSVLDTIYVGSMILDTDTGYVNEDYVKTELADADITFIDMSGQTPPLEYPEGYFAVVNPQDQTVSTIDTFNPNTPGTYIPGITGNTNNPTLNNGTTTDLTIKPQVTPTPNKNPVQGNLPTNANPTLRTRNRQNSTTTTKNNPTTQENQITSQNNTTETTNQNQKVESEPVKEVAGINKKPLEDLGDSINAKLAKNEVDLNKPFLVMMDGTITADGRLDKKNSRFVRAEGDPQMILVAKESIEAIGDSGFLAYLKNFGVDKANLTLKQDDTQIYVLLVSDQKDANKANTTASGFNTMLQGLILADKNGITKLDDNSRLLVNNAKVTTDGKNFVLTVTIPKADAQAMINKTLKDRAEKKKQTNSSVDKNNETNAQTTK
ncbi:hypothetical protein BH10ACI1_BH10ACI1_00070 [soil metagenome]